jgi:uncharacterized protein
MIGREHETQIMKQLLVSPKSEMLAVVGRRRVGKTYLIRNVYEDQIKFQIIGSQHTSLVQQLTNFKQQLQKYFGDLAPKKRPANWFDAFHQLSLCLDQQTSRKKPVIFIDELPWLAETSKKKFLDALGYFWNNYANTQKIIVVICGSAASWIIKNIVNAKGGLHNRVTKLIHLKPFSLQETKLFIQSKNIFLNHHEMIQLFMVFGGIPYYLDQIRASRSVAQIIQETCFDMNAPLFNEFDNLYKALFAYPDKYIDVIAALKSKWSGLTRQELIDITGKKDGGSLTKVLNDLVQCDFIIAVPSYNNKKNHIVYRLLDEFSVFYLSFRTTSITNKDHWIHIASSQAYKSWCGYAFENVCFRHPTQIVRALELQAINTKFSSFYFKGNSDLPGAQIDLVLERADNIIHLFEIKFHTEVFFITKAYSQDLRTKMAVFRQQTSTRKQLFCSMISVFGIGANSHSSGLISHSVTGDDFFV